MKYFRIVRTELPESVRGLVTEDGKPEAEHGRRYLIVINSLQNEDEQADTLRHELRHLLSRHIGSNLPRGLQEHIAENDLPPFYWRGWEERYIKNNPGYYLGY